MYRAMSSKSFVRLSFHTSRSVESICDSKISPALDWAFALNNSDTSGSAGISREVLLFPRPRRVFLRQP